MRGLLYAESIGLHEATEQLRRFKFSHNETEFIEGVMDYIRHANKKLITVEGTQ